MALPGQRGPPLGWLRRRVLLGGAGVGDAPQNSETPSIFFFGAAISASKTFPLPFAAAFFALSGRQRDWRPCSPEPASYLGQGAALLVLFVATFFALALALTAFFGVASFAAASYFGPALNRQKVSLSLWTTPAWTARVLPSEKPAKGNAAAFSFFNATA